jgi:hypothetical protein
MLWTLLWIVAAWAVFAGWLAYRYPLTPRPRWKFKSIIPRILNTGAVTVLGWCFVAGNRIGAHHRAHEEYHHRCVVRLGRWRHLWAYLWAFVGGLWRHRLGTYTAASGKRYLLAYWWHPEEIAARAYSDARHADYTPLGGKA